jgi:hypothetical protein
VVIPVGEAPQGIVFDAAGEMFVVNRGPLGGGSGSISRVTDAQGSPSSNGTIEHERFSAPHWATFRNGELFVGNRFTNSVLRFTFSSGTAAYNGEITESLGVFGAPGVDASPTTGDLFVSWAGGGHPIYRYTFDDAGDATLAGHISGPFDGARDMAFSLSGELFVGNLFGSDVTSYTFDDAGNATLNHTISGNGINGPLSLDFSPWGELFVLNHWAGTVSRFLFDVDGSPIPNGWFDVVLPGDEGLAGNSRISGIQFGSGGAPANNPPLADPNGPYLGAMDTPIAFDGTGSSDPDGDDLTYEWDFGDTGSGSGATPPHIYAGAEIYDVCLTVTDPGGLTDTACTITVVYDPSGGFVTGGGWIYSDAGADADDPETEGKANFGFVSKYKRGASVPTGNTEFQFEAADLNFHSSTYEWLVVTGSDYAKFKGSGTINGMGDYRFMLWAGDDAPDTFRIRIWTEDELGVETDVYDNGSDQAIGGGSIVIHTK